MTGKFIVIEGNDGSGKGTQFLLITERLEKEGHTIETADFPQYGKKSSALVQAYLNGEYGTADQVGPQVASIFYACDRFDASFHMKESLKQGKILIANRYETSNRAYQGQKIKDPIQRKEFFSWVTDLEYNIFKIPKPDLVIFLHVPADIAQELVGKKGKREYTDESHDIHEKDLELLKRTEQVYLELAKESNWVQISCVKDNKLMSIEEIHEEVYKVVKEFLGS